MHIYLFTDNKTVPDIFKKIFKSKIFTFIYNNRDVYKNTVKNCPYDTLIYYDISGLDDKGTQKQIKDLQKTGHRWGIIDPKNTINDISDLFFKDCSDYVGKTLIKEQLLPKRFDLIDLFKPIEKPEEDSTLVLEAPLSGKDWSEVQVGKKYTFTFMFIELDNISELKRNIGAAKAEAAVKIFRDYLEEYITPLGGQIWMWMDKGGLILFPFDGKSCDAILYAFRLMLKCRIINLETIGLDWILTYRIAMHTGITEYQKRGNTGKIVSDSINSIFHLGQKFAPKDSFCITDALYEFTLPGLKDSFVEEGEFEGRQIMRMRNLS